LHRTSDPWSARQQRHLAYLAEFSAKIEHIRGVDNVVADTLSRLAAAVTQATQVGAIDWSALAEEQKKEDIVAKLGQSSSLKLATIQLDGASVTCDTSTGIWRPVLVGEFRHQAFQQVHGLAHAGTKATTRMISARFVWPGLAIDVRNWCSECVDCGQGKISAQETAAVEKIDVPAQRFSHIHVDLVGPLPTTQHGNRYLVTAVDWSTRWP